MSENKTMREMMELSNKEFLTEGNGFKDSTEAAEFLEELEYRLASKKLASYLRETDTNFGSKTIARLRDVNKAIDKLMEEFYNAGN